MNHKTVYVPEQNGTIVDFAGSESITSCMEIVNYTSTHIGIENNFVLKKWNDLVSAHLLQKVENVNLFTDSELLELKKKWAEEAWDASKEYTYDSWDASMNMHPISKPDKETYLNNLNL